MYLAVFMGPFARGPRDDKVIIDYCIDQAVRAAEAKFSLVTFGEQHFNNYEPYSNGFMMGARLAPFLKDTYFGTSMCPLPYQNPLMLAEQINLLDQLCDGKLIVGLSAGRVGFSPDFENFGLDPKDQHAIFAEKFDALKQLWAHKFGDGPIKFDGKWVKGGMHGRMMPISYRAPRPLISIGTNTDETCRKVGRDGMVLHLGPASLENAVKKYAFYKEGLEEGGFSKEEQADLLAKCYVHHHVIVGESDDAAWQMAETMMGGMPPMQRNVDTRPLRQMYEDAVSGKTGLSEQEVKNGEFTKAWVVAGSPKTVSENLLEHEAQGIAQVLTRFTVGAYNPELWDRSFNLFTEEVMPSLNPQQFGKPVKGEVQPLVAQGPMPAGMMMPMGNGAPKNMEKPK